MPPSDSIDKIRILIADDHAIVRKGLAMVLRLEDQFEVVGEAGSGSEAISRAAALQPDVILLDRVMPGTDSGVVIRKIRQVAERSKIIMLTGTELDREVLELLKQGLDGYVLKDIEPQDLKRAIHTVASGEAYLQPSVTRHVLEWLGTDRASPSTDLLTPRELEIVKLMASQLTYREIAASLTVSEETVRTHAKHILGKLNQPNRAAAVLEAARLGIIRLPVG